MQKEIVIRIPPEQLYDEALHRKLLAKNLKVAPTRITHFTLRKRALDSRHARPVFELRYVVWVDESPAVKPMFELQCQDVRNARPILIVGAGPAGLFAALRLIELGLKPIILERGKSVRERRKDVAAISKGQVVNPDSNYCFGEGGAGTFSDGKLYTRATKRGSVERVLNILVANGAPPEILIDSHPHIGTNKLPGVVGAISDKIREAGGEIVFNERVTKLLTAGQKVSGLQTVSGNKFESSAVILASGHSARDILQMLTEAELALEAKPFALGVRVEHPQALIDELQYGQATRHPNLPTASYALRAQVDGRGVFSFCMCPGGIICPAATSPGEVVVNGWSPSKRNSRFANSGIVVEITAEDLKSFSADPVYAGIELQRTVENNAFVAGGSNLQAPAERLNCFLAGKPSSSLPECSYNPGVNAAQLKEVFPSAIYERLKKAFTAFERSRPGYITSEAIVVATESRTSSPVRIPRDNETLNHPQLAGLFPCGEGAGYAGGIMSAAMDGERVAEAVASAIL